MSAEQITADLKFSIIPEWLLDSGCSDKALRLYAVLSRYADNDDLTAYPGRSTLAKRMGCHRATVDRAVEELQELGAITKRKRVKDGKYQSSIYTIRRASPRRTGAATPVAPMQPPRRTHAATPVAPVQPPPSHPCDIELEPKELEPKELLAAAPRKNPKQKEPDLLFEAIARACTIDITQLTGSSRGQLNKATKELRDIGATSEQVGDKARAYRHQYEHATLTPLALVKHWPSLTVKQRKHARNDICSDCFQPLDDHDPEVHDLNAGRWR